MTAEHDDAAIAMQERTAHLERMVNDLSDVVARQDRELALLNRRVAMLMEREAERELDAGGAALIADQPPPHY